MKTKSNAGFSLVELMVVVAIIGILATVAVPNFMKFQAKAKQSSAKSELAGVYTAEKAFYVEYNTYHNNLSAIGFTPEGVTVAAGPTQTIAAGVTRLYQTGFNNAMLGIPTGMTALPPGFTAYNSSALNGYANVAAGTALTSAAIAAVPNTAFTASAQGMVRAGAPQNDVWTINENNALVNQQSGI